MKHSHKKPEKKDEPKPSYVRKPGDKFYTPKSEGRPDINKNER